MIVTIDGPAGSGKSTVARRLAEQLQFQFLDTGAMYRVVAWYCLKESIDLENEAAVVEAVGAIPIRVLGDQVLVEELDVTQAIRTPEVTQAASVVATYGGVRHEMVRQQRELAKGQDVVTEGRDQGTTAFSDAECKFYLVANLQERALRRYRELVERADVPAVSLDEIRQQIAQRDERDATRSDSPLKPADDAIVLDTSHLAVTDVVDQLEKIVHLRMANDT